MNSSDYIDRINQLIDQKAFTDFLSDLELKVTSKDSQFDSEERAQLVEARKAFLLEKAEAE